MTALDRYSMNPYSIDAPYEEYDNFASYRIASPKNGLSPALGSQEYSALLDAFTNNANDDYNTGQSMDSPKIYGNHSQSQPGRDQGPGQIRHQGTVGAGPFSSVQAGYSSTGGSVFNTQISPAGTGGLGIHSDPAAATSAQANYNAMYTASHRPNSQTVSHLEALADASPPRVRTSSSYLGNAGPGYSDLASSRLGRQASSQSFLEGPHMSALSLNSPRNSVSGGSSAPSSSQNSPVTPLSAYSQDGLSFQAQQQQRQMATQAYHYAYQEQQYASGQYGPNAQHTAYSPAQTLSMSTPASYSSSGVHEKTQSQLARSQGRMSSAGLMDQIVSSRRAVVSPVSSSATPDAIASSKSRRTSRSVSKSTTPPAPATPARHLVQGNSAAGPSQTMSSAGPHRTPAKRNSLHEGSAQYMTMSGTASTTPKRPGTLRRTASHTPGSTSAEASMPASGLASPADLQGVAQRAQNAAQTAMASAMQPAHKARIAESAGLEFPGMSTGMTRARSSPGLTLLSNPPHSRSHLEPSALSPLSASTSSRKSRSNTFSNLYMSPLGPPRATTSDAAPLPVSFDEALLAADRLTAFLSHQATLIRPDGPDTALSVLGTYEQLQAVGDIKARVVARMSNR